MVAVNIFPEEAPLALWKRFWRSVGGNDDVVFAEDPGRQAVRAFGVRALGTKIILDRQGQVAYRDAGPTPYETLQAAVDRIR